jgi:hypothetical protein
MNNFTVLMFSANVELVKRIILPGKMACKKPSQMVKLRVSAVKWYIPVKIPPKMRDLYLKKTKKVPLPCLRRSLKGPMNLKTFVVTKVSKCHKVLQCVTSTAFPN